MRENWIKFGFQVGTAVSYGRVRSTPVYVSGVALKDDGVAGDGEIGDGALGRGTFPACGRIGDAHGGVR